MLSRRKRKARKNVPVTTKCSQQDSRRGSGPKWNAEVGSHAWKLQLEVMLQLRPNSAIALQLFRDWDLSPYPALPNPKIRNARFASHSSQRLA